MAPNGSNPMAQAPPQEEEQQSPLERFGRDRALLVMAVDCGGNADLTELGGEGVEPYRNIEDAAQEIDMRARSAPCLRGRAQG